MRGIHWANIGNGGCGSRVVVAAGDVRTRVVVVVVAVVTYGIHWLNSSDKYTIGLNMSQQKN
jgi:hypothetical protein